MVRTLSLEGLISNIKNSINNNFINKVLSNPVLLSIIIVLFITLIILNSKQLFKGIVFSILITSGLLFCHNNIIKKSNIHAGKQEMTNYFTGMAENSVSNINNISTHEEISGGIDNLDIQRFFEDN